MINYNEKYFLMSFKFDKNKPENFNLAQSHEDENIFINTIDKSQWLKRNLYDFGWGNEYGFVKLPILDFNDFWDLLVNSSINENKYGAAYILETDYADNLKRFLLELFSNSNLKVTESMKGAFKALKLDTVKNRSQIIGKSLVEINKDFEDWKFISDMVKIILR